MPSGRSTSPTRARSSGERVSQPTVSKDGASGSSPSVGTSPCVVRMPQSPWYAAGTRIEPPVSVPRPTVACPSETAEADPEDEPPEIR